MKKEFQKIPNVGPKFAQDLIDLGIVDISEIKGQDPLDLYKRLEKLSGSRQDPCVLDTFMAIVDYAQTGQSRPWFSFTGERKQIYRGKF